MHGMPKLCNIQNASTTKFFVTFQFSILFYIFMIEIYICSLSFAAWQGQDHRHWAQEQQEVESIWPGGSPTILQTTYSSYSL